MRRLPPAGVRRRSSNQCRVFQTAASPPASLPQSRAPSSLLERSYHLLQSWQSCCLTLSSVRPPRGRRSDISHPSKNLPPPGPYCRGLPASAAVAYTRLFIFNRKRSAEDDERSKRKGRIRRR